MGWKTRLALSIVIGIGGLFIAYFSLKYEIVNFDSALIFVGLPVALAIALAIAPIPTTHGRVFQITTICLLLVAVLAHEGAVCVLLAAPLVYGVAHSATAAVRFIRGHRAYALLLPLLLLSSVEGVDQNWRVSPIQTVEVVRVVALDTAEVSERIRRGPSPAPLESWMLKGVGVPTPAHVQGMGLDPGGRWMFAYHGSSHGPGGHTTFEVTASTANAVSFRIVEDSAITARWFDWRTASVQWEAVDEAHTRVRLVIEYRRGLDPSWYFGPLNDVLLHEGGAHLLDMLDLR